MTGPYTALRQGLIWYDEALTMGEVLALYLLTTVELEAVPRRHVTVCLLTSTDMDAQILVMN